MARSEQIDPSHPRRLALVIHALSGGGAERVLTNMANHWASQGFHVTLITLATAEADLYQTDSSVERVYLDVMRESRGAWSAVYNNIRRATTLRRALSSARPHFVVSFTDQINVLTLMATFGMRLRVIICDRVDPRHHPLGRAWSTLRRQFYRRCFSAVVQTESVKNWIQPLVGRKPVYIVPNAVSPDAHGIDSVAMPTDVAEIDRPHRLLAMGRLSSQKGFDLLIEAFAKLADQHPNWNLEIYGEGPLRGPLEQHVARLKLGDRIHLPGWTDDRLAEFSRADVFVLSSRYEGFPNVLLDAMACGLPAVAFDCPSGPAEIVRHTIDGLLVEPNSVDALADALHQIMADASCRRDYAVRAADVRQRFSPERFYSQWEAVFAGASPDDQRFASAAPVEQA